MKILHIIDDLTSAAGGLSQMVPKFCSALSEQNLNLSVVSFGESLSDAASDSLAHGLDIRNNAFSRFSHVKYLLGPLPSIVRGFDVVHLHAIWLPCNWSAAGSARRNKIPFIVSLHGTLEPWALNHKAWKKKIAWWAIEKRNIKSAAVLHATAGQEADNLRKLGLRNPIAVIPNGVDLPILNERTDSSDTQRTVLFLSRIHPIKGLLNLVEAWRRVHPLGWKLVIAGIDEDRHEARVKAVVKDAGLEDRICFTGPVFGEAKRELFESADVFVLPTFSENFGLVVAEALSFGVPVITTKGAPWRELQEHKCGWWVDIGVEPLAEALREAVSISDDDRREIGARGRRLVAERYAWPSVANEMKSVYEWMLGGGQPPPCVMTE
jgi:glycosyltransferase involved in cell wall biosynthesis